MDLMDPLEFRDQQEQPAVLDHRASKVHQELGYVLLFIFLGVFTLIPIGGYRS